MSTGRPPIALALIDDDLQARCLRLRRRLTDSQAAAFASFLSFRSVHLLTWLNRCFPSLEGQLARGALPAIMRVDAVVKLSPASIYRGQLFDKRRLWVCTDTHLMVFREDGALKVQVAIADIAEVIHLRVATPIPYEEPTKGQSVKESMAHSLDGPAETHGFLSHRPTSICHAVVFRCPHKRDVGAFFGPSAVSVNLLVQYVLNRRRVAVVNYAMRTNTMQLPASASQEAAVTRPAEVFDTASLVQFLTASGIQLKRPAGSAASVTLSAPALPLVTAASAAVEIALGATVYQEALRELESNATKCREETADTTCQLLMSAHLEYSAVLRQSLSLKGKTVAAAAELKKLTSENDRRQHVASEKLKAARGETQRLASEMLGQAGSHSQTVASMRETCLTSEDRSKKSLDDANDDDFRCGIVLTQLADEGRFLELSAQQQKERLAAIQASLPSIDDLRLAIAHLKERIEAIRTDRKGVDAELKSLKNETELRTGLTDLLSSSRPQGGSSPSPTQRGGSISNLAATPSKEKSPEGRGASASPSVANQEEVKYLEEQAMEALELKRNGIEFLAKARIAHANEGIVLQRKKERCDRLADELSATYDQNKEIQYQLDGLRREIDLVQKRISVLPLEALLCDDLKRAQVIEASIERSVRAGGAPSGLKSSEDVIQMQLAHLRAIKERMQSAVERKS